MKSNTLTHQELESAYLANIDLGSGYPQLIPSDNLRNLYVDRMIMDLSLTYSPKWDPDQQQLLDNDLKNSVLKFLDISSPETITIYPTFSGSTALDRTIQAVLNNALRSGKHGLKVVTTSPCIDIMQIFLEERVNIHPEFVNSKDMDELFAFNIDGIINAVRQTDPKTNLGIAVLISSPENPTGQYWHEEDLRVLAKACKDSGATLIVDHCFVVAGVHDRCEFHSVWDLDRFDCNWIGIWDTGKTFGLNEDKLGFIFTRSEAMSRELRNSINLLQFDISRRSKLFFTKLLKESATNGYVTHLRQVCQTNLEILNSNIFKHLHVISPDSGSLCLLDINKLKIADETLRLLLLKKYKIGVIAGNVFFHKKQWMPTNFIRLPLAREQKYFENAIEHLNEALKSEGF